MLKYAKEAGDARNNADDGDEQVEEEEKLTSVSQVVPSFISGRTYISDLHKQLDEERNARMKLESEIESLKKVSEEITSQLS